MNVNELISKDAAKAVEDVRALLEAHNIKSICFKTDSDAEGGLKTRELLRKSRLNLQDEQKEEMGPHFTKYTCIRDHFGAIIKKITMVEKAFDDAYKVYEAEKNRIAKEAQALINKKKDEENRKKEEQAQKAEEKAETLTVAGRADLAEKQLVKAQEIRESAVVNSAPLVMPNVVKNTRGGFNTRTSYKAEIVDMKQVYYHFHKNGLPPSIMDAVQKYFDQQARASRGTKSPYGGVKFVKVG